MSGFSHKFIGASVLTVFCICSVLGATDAGKIKFEAGFIPERDEIMLGEPLYVTFYVTNTGSQTFYLETCGDYRGVRSSRFEFKAVDADGHPALDPYPDAPNLGGILSTSKVSPGTVYSEKLYLPLWIKFDHVGKYVIRGRRTIQFLDKEGFPQNYASVQPFATDFKLTVRPMDINRLGERIKQLANLLDSADAANAARQLGDIEDERVVSYLVRIIEQNQRDVLAVAAEGLGKHPGPEAVNALAKALQVQGDSFVRWKAVEALGNMKSASAVDVLIPVLNDGDEYLRKDAADSLGKLNDKRAIEPLKARLVDPSMIARLASVEALYTLGESFHAEWVLPIIQSEQLNEFQNAVWFVRKNAGSIAPILLARCLDMKNPSVTNYYNYTLTWQIAACGGPSLTYHHEFNHEGTPEQIKDNQQTLKALVDWANSMDSSTKAALPTLE